MKELIINRIIDVEGGYVDDPNDSGGETNYGITIKTARAYGFNGEMKDLSRRLAFKIYEDKYWNSVRATSISNLSKLVAHEVVDTAVNMGPNRAGAFLQRSLNVLNNKGAYYDDLIVDGKIGPATIIALDAYLSKREEEILVKMLNCLQGAFYVRLAEKREKDETFIYGWFKNRVEV